MAFPLEAGTAADNGAVDGDSTMYWAVYERFLRLKKLCGSGGETEKSRKFNKARGKKGCGKKFGKAKTRPQEDDSCPPDSEFERYGDE